MMRGGAVSRCRSISVRGERETGQVVGMMISKRCNYIVSNYEFIFISPKTMSEHQQGIYNIIPKRNRVYNLYIKLSLGYYNPQA